MSADARAWSMWLVGALAVVFLLDHPAIDLIVTFAAGLVATRAGRDSPFRSFLVLGLTLVAIRTVLFALTGHTGATTLFEIPAVRLPDLLGGTTLGGRVTAEVVVSSLAEGMRIISVMASFAALLAVTETIDLVRLLPRSLFEAGLVVNIALAFAPQLATVARDVREAQKMRGERRRVVPLVVPVFISALERAIALAESMDSRGYGRSDEVAGARRWQALAAIGAILAAASGSFWAMRRSSTPAAFGTIVGTTLLVWSLVSLNKLVPRTRYRRSRFGRTERMISGAAAIGALIAVALVASLTMPGYDPYQSLAFSAPNPVATAAAAALAVPPLFLGRYQTR